MDNITSFIIENKTWLLTVLTVGGAIWGMDASDSKKMREQRQPHKAHTDRMSDFKVGLVMSTLLVVALLLLPSMYVGFKAFVAKQINITLLTARFVGSFLLEGSFLLLACKIIVQYGVHIFLLCAFSIPSQRKIDLHQKGIDYFHEGDYENAMKCFLSSCKFHGRRLFAGWATSECYIGRMFFEGKGVKKDYKIAVKWFRKATELLCLGHGLKISDPNACEWLGYCYEHGYGVEEDLDIALHWYKEAADIYKEDEDERFEDVKKRWEELSGESHGESDVEENLDEEVADDVNVVDEDDDEVDDTEEESDEEEDYAEDDEGGGDEDGEEGDEDDEEDYADPMDELNAMIGLESVKREVAELKDFLALQQARQKHGLRTAEISNHCVFLGNPGTGKTTVARIVARLYHQMGIISSDNFVEADRSKLVGEYIGETAVKTNELIDSALDGVLFIDEAYTLDGGSENDFGREAVATLLKRMEDDRDHLIVIAAGYTDEMKRFMELNPGLKSRFTRTIEFPDYTAYELAEIFFKMAEDGEYVCTPKIKEAVVDAMNDIITNKGKDFGNGRVARNFYEEAIKKLAKRIAAESGQLKNGNKRIRLLTRFTVGDIKSALQTIEMNLRNGASKKGT